LLFSDLLW